VFDPYDAEIAKYIKLVTAYKVTNVLEFTKSHIASIILAMRADNATTDAIARRIRDEIGQFSTHRAFRIARTEVASAANYGSFTAAKQTGIVQMKKWVSSRDKRVRKLHTHDGVDGETVKLDEKFSNGLLHPGDFAGAAKEVIHCRCALSYTVRTRALSR
jgi:SPP1 gp7 family putative phage head morphogenesis protein